MSTQLPASSGNDPVLNNFDRIWKDALGRYETEIGKNPLELPFAKNLPARPGSAEVVIEHFKKQEDSFKVFRDVGKKVFGVLETIVHFVHLFIDSGAEAAASHVPGGKAILVAVGVLLQATKGVSGVYNAVETLLDKIKNYLQRVSIHLKPSILPSPTLMDILVNTLVHIFTALALTTKYCDAVVKGDPQSKKNSGRAIIRRTKDFLRVLVGRTGVQEVLVELDALTDKERLVTAAETYAVVRDTQAVVLDTHTIVQEREPQARFVYDETVVNGLRSWLHAPDPRPANYDKKSKPGTCQWFIEGQQFQAFKASKGNVYWVYGNAGAGKSVLCSSVLDSLREDATLLLAYFYLDYSILDKQEGWHGLIASLVFQLGTGPQACFDYLEKKRNFDHSRDRPTYSRLLEMLLDLLLMSGPTVLVIDALDELPESARRDYLLPFLEDLRNLDPDRAELRLFITSRPESDLWQYCMAGPSRFATYVLDLDDAAEHRGELNVYVAAQLSRLNLSRWPAIKAKAETILVERANGMFLWVELQLPRLKRCVSVDDVEDTLLKLPSGLHDTYQRILESIDSSDVSINRARRVFECIASSERPLTVAQTIEIFFIDIDSPAKTPVDMVDFMERVDDLEAFILEKCPGFLNIADTLIGLDSKITHRTVQFIHFSVQEYLMSSDLKKVVSSVRHYSFEESSANLTLARICLLVLVADSALLELQAYADECWYQHISSHNEIALSELLDPFLHINSPAFTQWVARSIMATNNDTAFHWAAKLGLYRRVEMMLEFPGPKSSTPDDSIVRTRDGTGSTALHEAARRGRTEICRLLLNHGALIDDTNNNGHTPLLLATYSANLDTIHLLLEYPAPDGSNAATLRCRARNAQGQTALHQAAYYGHARVCCLLLEHGASVDELDNNSKNPLHYAARFGDLNTVRLLLDHPAAGGTKAATLRCHARDKDGQTALHEAAYMGHCVIGRLLLKHGAPIDDADGHGKTPLHCATSSGDLDTVRLLLKHPAVDGSDAAALRCCARDKDGWTALHEAAYRGNTEICRLLLDHGALVNETDNYGNTPLRFAKEERKAGVIDILRKHGAATGPNTYH